MTPGSICRACRGRCSRHLLRLFDREEELELILGHRADIDADVLVLLSILEVDDIRDDGEGRPVADPAVIGVLQRRAGIGRGDADRGRDIGRELQVQHLLDEDRKNDVERLLVGGLGGGSEPQSAFVEIIPLRGDLVHPLD